MEKTVALQRLVGEVARIIKWRRALFYGLRGLFYGAALAVLPLLLKGLLGPIAPLIAGGLIGLGAAAGVALGYLLRIPLHEAARLLDRAFDLKDRTATALEWGGRADRSPLIAILVEDAAARLQGLDLSGVVPRRWPHEGKLLPAPALLVVALLLTPPVPIPSGALPAFPPSSEEERQTQAGDLTTDERSKSAKVPLLKSKMAERNPAAPQDSQGQQSRGDLSAIFKDTALGLERPDFNSFLKKGDERLRMLEQVDRLPDLKGDFTQSRSKVIFQRMKALSGGLRPDQFSPEKMREILDEMKRLGQKGGDWGDETFEGMDALNQGENNRAWKAMEKALNKMRAMEDRDRSGKNLRGGLESDRRGSRGRERPEAGDEFGERDLGEGEMGSLPGKGANPIPKGEATARLRGSPFDTGVEGESRAGRRDGFDTNMLGRGTTIPSTMRYLGLLGQYRKMMEEALAREQVPRDYQGHVKEYFQSLEER